MGVLFVSLAIVLLDQFTKLFIKGINIPWLGIHFSGIPYGKNFDVLGSFFRITFVENPGMAFGINVDGLSKLLLSLFSLFASVALIVYLYKVKNKPFFYRFALSLIIAGAVGNLIDRTFYGVIYGYAPIFYGRVVDFLNFKFFNITLFGHTYDRFPIFNIADSSVTIGVFLLLFYRSKMERKLKSSAATNEEEILIEAEEIRESEPEFEPELINNATDEPTGENENNRQEKD